MLNFAQIGIMGSVVSSGSGFDADVQAWLDQLAIDGATTPTVTVQNALSDFATSLKSYGLWTRMKTGYILHSGDTTVGRRNLKDPATYRTTLSGTLTFSEGNGTKSNGTSYINQPFTSNEFAGIETDLTVVQYVSESATTAATIASHGFMVNSNGSMMVTYPLQSGVNGLSNTYNTAGAPRLTFTSNNHKGLYVSTHNGTGNVMYKDGVKTSNTTAAVAPNLTQNRTILAFNNNTSGGVSPLQFYTRYLSVDFLFDQFDDTDELNFRTAFDDYKTAVGLP